MSNEGNKKQEVDQLYTLDFFSLHLSHALQTRFLTGPSAGDEASGGGVRRWAAITLSVSKRDGSIK
jgi:hypothetical protein